MSKIKQNSQLEEKNIADATAAGNLSIEKKPAPKKAAKQDTLQEQITLFDENLQTETQNEPATEIQNEKVEVKSTLKSNNENLKPSTKKNLKITTEHIEKKQKKSFLNFNKPPKKMLQIETTPEEENEKMDEAEQAVKKQSSKKKKLLNLLFFLINIGIVVGLFVYNFLSDTQMTSFSELFTSKINWWIFLLAVVVSSLNMILDAVKSWILIWKTTGKNRVALSYKTCALGRHYDAVTPMSTGGEPFQVYYLNKHGIPAGKAVSIPLGQYVTYTMTFSIFSLFIMIASLIVSSNTENVGTTIVSAGAWIGFAINFALVLVVCLVSINKKVGTGLITGILKLLKKMHLIKNYEQTYNKAIGVVTDYQKTMVSYAKSKSTFSLCLLLSLLLMITRYSIPYIIYAMFNGFNPGIFVDIFIKTVMIDLASSFFPLPGGSGVAELSFTAFFSSLMGADIFWAMLIWRILTHYSNMIRGTIIIIYDYAIGNKKFKWTQKKWQLEEESKKFEDAQLKDFEMTLVKQNKRKNKKKEK